MQSPWTSSQRSLQVVPLPFMAGKPPVEPFETVLAAATSGSRATIAAVRQLPWCSYAARIDLRR